MELPTSYAHVTAVIFDVELVEMDGEEDHVPLLVNYPPKLAVSSLVNSLKGVSSRSDKLTFSNAIFDKNYSLPRGYRFVPRTYRICILTTPNRQDER